MPSPATPHRPSNRGGSAKPTPTKPLDIGQPLGVHDTNSVRARVRKWQQQGGGVVTIDDGIYDDDDEENKTPKAKPKPAKAKLDRPEKSNKEPPAATRKRSHSTPRKRVISDEHWRRNRSTTQTQTPTRNLPMPKRINEYTTNEGSGSPRAKRDNKKDDSGKNRDIPRYGARRDAPASRSPIREAKQSASRKRTESVTDSDLESDRPTRTAKSDIADNLKRHSPPPEDIDWARSEADFSELSRRRARGPSKPPKGGIFAHMLDESRKMFTRPEAEPPKPQPQPPGNRGSKIEAWLSETPDPFLDDNDSKSDMPGPLDIKSARARRSRRLAEGENASIISSEPPENESRPKSSHSRHSKDRDRPSSSEKLRNTMDGVAPSDSKRASPDHPHKGPSTKPKEESSVREKPYEASIVTTQSDLPIGSDGSEVSGNNAPVPLSRKKPFPSTGNHRLSTIASVETLSTLPEGSSSFLTGKSAASERDVKTVEAEENDQFDPDSLPAVSSQLKRRLTTHNDLMSVLSVPVSRSRSIRSTRSIRTNKSRLANATIPDLMTELSADETKYMRELKTLVGGVIPVLLTCVLSRSDSAIAAGLFRPSMDPKDDLNFSKPIVNMGVAIERLKTLHKRIPRDDAEALLNWAQGAQRVYREYLKAWRLGFKDVIVNLAPLEEGESNDAETKSLDEGMERDENGDVIDSDGGKVDVAYLLKRPLVRLKYLAKSFKGINTLQPSTKAEEVANSYQTLVLEARKRARDERARLEDESAATIDPTRARDPMTMGVLQTVTVDQTRRVRARDFFNLSLYHSSGQLVDCRAELLYRDNTPSNGPGGDLMICEIDHADRWLLFPPMDLRCVSARNGDTKGEIVVMLRSAPEEDKYWQELISLRIDDVDIGLEWVQLLGSDPIPPSICRSQSFISRAKQHKARKSISSDSPPRPTPSDVDIPIGERRRSSTLKEHYSEPSTVSSIATETRSSLYSAITRETGYTTGGSELSTKQTRPGLPALPSTVIPDKSASGLKRSKAKRHSRYGESPTSETASPKAAVSDKTIDSSPATGRLYGEGKEQAKATDSPKERSPQKAPQTPERQETTEAESPRVSSVPSATLPLIPKIRSASSQTHLSTPTSTRLEGEEEDYPPLESLPDQEVPETPTRTRRRKSRRKSKHEDSPPPPPPHRSPSSAVGKLSNTPTLSPSAVRLKRRGSSPLKHEYEPSTASDSYSDSDSDASTVRHYAYSSSEYSQSVSDSDSYSSASASEDEQSELPKPRPLESATSETSSLSPSNSASQGGYRAVPLQPAKSSRAVASIFAWCDKGTWESLLPDECSIAVSPGLIEAFKMGADPNANSPERSSKSSRPLISMELTPLVPIRRGTAIDISIRSPPTERSKITSSNNIMFRSRNPDECDSLYSLINQARINNPTYIALQNARGPFNDMPPTFQPAATKDGGSWFGFPRRRKSYRASGSPRSLAEGSESSVGTMSSAFSALKRFGAGSRMFNIARSTVTSRNGRENSMYSDSAESSQPSPSSGIGRIAAAIKGADGIGLSNAKIRIYLRETASKWRDMGAARLTIMPAPPKNPSRPGTAVSGRSESSATHGDGSSSTTSSGAATPRRDVEPEKRIIIRGKTRGEVLLDVCLPESSFERVARTGIAVSVYEENEGGAIAKQGGVTASSQRIYMIQMKSEAEAAYTFGLVGKLRY
ncbi:uncharacterized protein N7459_007643 [Penicillium hispanicum]|uniref:uncharacterized protein n=1 Tax=Penicillium hispanicum TaxID=1080232 RepID=UPI0025401101|nr:uncharacterized protein N7459_007643 [Penicillium hispanicum]KAJ5578679.1 hypothetical protein N7459_007643 [Penicillium hispanicum]